MKIQALRGAFKGDRVWIVGNGPSAENWSIEEMRDFGGHVFGVNRCWRTSPRTGACFQWTDFHTFVSGHHYDDLMHGRVHTGTAFMPSRYTPLMVNHVRLKEFQKTGPEVVEVNLSNARWNSSADGRPWNFHFDRSRVVSTFAGHLALALAVYMGFSDVLLVGFDARDGEGHFFDKLDGPRTSPVGFKRDQMVKWFDAIGEWMIGSDCRIWNTNPESAIRVFPFATKEEIRDGILEGHVFGVGR